MSEYESMDRNAADPSVSQPADYPLPPSAPTPEGGPHHQADPHQVVARMPDLSRSEREIHVERPQRRKSRRREGLDPLVKLYIGAGCALVVVILAMVFWSVGKKTDVSDNQDSDGWDIKAPHPDAPTAPLWQSSTEETQNWESQDNLANYGQPDAYQADRSWNNAPPASQSPGWAEEPRGAQPNPAALSGQTQPRTWSNQPDPRGWDPQDTAAAPGQPQWGSVDTQAQAYPQSQPYGAAPSGPTPRQSAAMGQVRQTQPDASPWNVDVQAVPVQMPSVPARQAEVSPRVGRDMGTPPAMSSYADQQTGTYQSEYEAAVPSSTRRDAYQTAPSAQYGTRAIGGMTSGSSYQARESYPPTGTTAYPAAPATTYPAAPVTRQSDPAVIARRDNYSRDYRPSDTSAYRPGGTSTYRPSDTSAYRPGGTDTYRPETASRQAPVGAAMGSGPASNYRAPYSSTIPSTSTRSYQSVPDRYAPTNGQRATAAPAATYPASNTGASTLYPQSGTARFTGEIEKPTARTTYDYTRSSLY